MKATPEQIALIASAIDSANNGHTLETVRTFLMKEATKQQGSASLEYNKHGFRLFYTINQNYANGAKNGFGAGFYASLHLGGIWKQVKIDIPNTNKPTHTTKKGFGGLLAANVKVALIGTMLSGSVVVMDQSGNVWHGNKNDLTSIQNALF